MEDELIEIILSCSAKAKRLKWQQTIQKNRIIEATLSSESLKDVQVGPTAYGCILVEGSVGRINADQVYEIRRVQRLGWSVFVLLDGRQLPYDSETIEPLCHVFSDCLIEGRWTLNDLQQRILDPRSPEEILMGLTSSGGKGLKGFFSTLKPTPAEVFEPIKHLKICTWGNSLFAHELAVYFASEANKKTLIMDVDRLSPSTDFYFGINSQIDAHYEALTMAEPTGLNVLIDALKRGGVNQFVVNKACRPVRGLKKLEVLTGCHQFKEFEYYIKEDFIKTLEVLSPYFEVIIIKVNAYAYDGFSAVARLLSDLNIAAYPLEKEHMRYFSQLTAFMEETQGNMLQKSFFVEYDESSNPRLERLPLKWIADRFYLGKIEGRGGKPFLGDSKITLSKTKQQAFSKILIEWKRRCAKCV